MSNTRSYQISDKLFLVKQQPHKTAPAKPVEVPTNHILVIDCSGSMYGELPKIREQLKKKLPKMVSEKDTVSIIWFSGRGQCGVLLEAEPVATLSDLASVNKAIDRWLQSQGLTGFKEPLEEVSKLVKRLQKSRPGSANSLFFLSDGCDNCWPRADILKCSEIEGINASTFVEYSYYADRQLLAAMAEKAGGTLIFSERFDQFIPTLEASLAKKVTGAPKIGVSIEGDVVGGFAFALDGEDLLTFAVENGKVRIPESVESFAYLVNYDQKAGVGEAYTKTVSDNSDSAVTSLAYAALSLFATRMNSNVVFALLRSLGDVQFIEQFTNCFGKQAYSAFQQSTKLAAIKPTLRLTKGYDPNRVPREDAFTVLDLFNVLSSDDGNRLLLGHSAFKYSPIGRGRVDSSTLLSAEDQAKVDELTEEMSKAKGAKKISEIAAKISAITEGKEGLKFEGIEAPDGYEINGLVWNEERPNLSLRVVRQGTVDISTRCPDNLKGTIPQAFPTFQFRNYTMVKDGLINVEVLPVFLTKATHNQLSQAVAEGRASDFMSLSEDGVILINLKSIPVINRQMVKTTSAKALFQLEWELTKARAAQKVFKAYKDELLGKRKSEGYVEKYGQEAADWLKEQGFTDYSGFSPKSVQAEATDFYMSKEMGVSIKSFSSLPSLKQAREKHAKGKTTPSEALLMQYIQQADAVLGSATGELSDAQKRMLNTWLDEETKSSVSLTRALIFKKAQILFSILVGQAWFQEFASLDENSMELDVDGQKLSCKVEMVEKEVKI